MSNVDWYAKKLGQPAPERRETTPPVQFTPGVPAVPTQPAQPWAPHPASQQFQAPQRFEPANWADLDKEQRREFLINNPKPGKGNADAKTCPECGSGNLFSRRNTSGLRNGDSFPAPQCYDCGWPVVQAGSVGGALGA